MADFGGAAAGAVAGMQQVEQSQLRQFELQQARQQAAERQAAQNAQQQGIAAARKRLMELYGVQTGMPQPPMPGQASVPMQQPPQGLPPTGGAAPQMGLQGPVMSPMPAGGPGSAPAPTLPPYRALQRGGAPMPQAAPSGMPQQFELPSKPPRLDMASILQGAPQNEEAYKAYMAEMEPYLSAQGKSELEQQKLELQYERIKNQLYESEQRIANATTPAERKAALEANLALRGRLADIAQENADTRKEAAGEKKTKGSEKMQAVEDARAKEQALVDRLIKTVTEHPEVVGLSGKLTRAGEWIGGATGATQSTVAHDFQTDVRDLQNIIKKIESFGPEGRVLKGELADRDVIVRGLGAMESAPSVLSNLMRLKQLTGIKRGEGAGAAPAGPKPGTIEPDDQGRRYKFKGGNPNDAKNWERV